MGPLIYWRIAIIAALALCGWKLYDLIGDKRELVRALNEHTTAIRHLDGRADRYDATLVENQSYDVVIDREASTGIAHNETARRVDREVITFDRPWPAGMRRRVFDNPDPASGSTATAGAAPARTR